MARRTGNLFYVMLHVISVATISCTLQNPQTPPESRGRSSYGNETDSNLLDKSDYVDDIVKDLNCTDFIVEAEYILLENGSLVLPGERYVHLPDTYYLTNNSAYICASADEMSVVAETYHHFSKEFLSCGHVLIEPEEYNLLQNGTVFIEMYTKFYEPSDYYIQELGVYVCVPKYEEMQHNMTTNNSALQLNKFSEHFTYVTYIGISISILSLVSHLIVFCAVSSVRNLPGCCLASLSLSLLVAYLCFLSSSFVETTEACANLGLCVYYFFLTSFFWMNAIAFDVWRSFRVVVRELRISSHRIPRRRFFLYSLYSWATPAVLALFVKMADATDLLPPEFKPSFGVPICWFGKRKPLLVFFAAPLCAVMLLNGVFFLDVTYVISRATMKSSQSQEATLKKRFFMFMRLALIMGLTWVVGIVAGYVDNEALWYLFVVLNTLQGLFIFVVFSCSSKVRVLCCDRFKNRSRSRTSTSVRTISQVSGAV